MNAEPGTWKDGNPCDAIVTDEPLYSVEGPDGQDVLKHYGGFVVAESVHPPFKSLIKAAPEMYEALALLGAVVDFDQELSYAEVAGLGITNTSDINQAFKKARAALAKAEGRTP